MRVIVHAGMPKTGSSAIQASMSQLDAPGLAYLPSPGLNPGPVLATLFEDRPEQHRAFAFRPNPAAAVENIRAKWLPQIEEALSENGAETVLVSSERIFNVPPEVKQRMHDFFAARRADVSCIVYVRPAASYLSSAFQQNAAAGDGPLALDKVWPRYRQRIGALDRAFGRGKVDAVKFDRACLHGGDAVLDFAHRIGVHMPEDKLVNVNESRPLQAIAVLYAIRRLREDGAKLPRLAPRDQADLSTTLAALGADKFSLAPALIEPVMAQFSDDLAWIEERLGQPMGEMPKATGNAIASTDQLMDIAREQRQALSELLAANTEGQEGALPPHLDLMKRVLALL